MYVRSIFHLSGTYITSGKRHVKNIKVGEIIYKQTLNKNTKPEL